MREQAEGTHVVPMASDGIRIEKHDTDEDAEAEEEEEEKEVAMVA